jgi:hypothetical protein
MLPEVRPLLTENAGGDICGDREGPWCSGDKSTDSKALAISDADGAIVKVAGADSPTKNVYPKHRYCCSIRHGGLILQIADGLSDVVADGWFA